MRRSGDDIARLKLYLNSTQTETETSAPVGVPQESTEVEAIIIFSSWQCVVRKSRDLHFCHGLFDMHGVGTQSSVPSMGVGLTNEPIFTPPSLYE